MGSPKNFKEIFQALPKQRQKFAVYAPLPSAPPAKIITPAQREKQQQQYKEMMELVNSERCPLCGAQLDGGVYYSHADVWCAANGEDEYKAHYIYGLKVPQYNTSTIYTDIHAYEIYHQYISDKEYLNIMYKIDLSSYNKVYRQRNKEKILDYKGTKLFLDKNISEEKILKKLKLYRVFS